MATTIKDRTRFRPLLEPLESVLLLSQVASLQPHAEAKKAPAPAPPVDVQLLGTLHGSGTLSGSVVTASGSGSLGKVGSTSFHVKVNLSNLPTSVTLSAKKGNITLVAEGTPTVLSNGYTTQYEVEGGTKTYAAATGSGTLTASYTLLKGHKVSLTFKLS